jgi:hypothetical protein
VCFVVLRAVPSLPLRIPNSALHISPHPSPFAAAISFTAAIIFKRTPIFSASRRLTKLTNIKESSNIFRHHQFFQVSQGASSRTTNCGILQHPWRAGVDGCVGVRLMGILLCDLCVSVVQNLIRAIGVICGPLARLNSLFSCFSCVSWFPESDRKIAQLSLKRCFFLCNVPVSNLPVSPYSCLGAYPCHRCHPWSFARLNSFFHVYSVPPHSLIIPRELSLREEQSDENDPLLPFCDHFVSRKRAFFPENARTTVQSPRRLEA